jgi:hypothetical protein
MGRNSVEYSHIDHATPNRAMAVLESSAAVSACSVDFHLRHQDLEKRSSLLGK